MGLGALEADGIAPAQLKAIQTEGHARELAVGNIETPKSSDQVKKSISIKKGIGEETDYLKVNPRPSEYNQMPSKDFKTFRNSFSKDLHLGSGREKVREVPPSTLHDIILGPGLTKTVRFAQTKSKSVRPASFEQQDSTLTHAHSIPDVKSQVFSVPKPGHDSGATQPVNEQVPAGPQHVFTDVNDQAHDAAATLGLVNGGDVPDLSVASAPGQFDTVIGRDEFARTQHDPQRMDDRPSIFIDSDFRSLDSQSPSADRHGRSDDSGDAQLWATESPVAATQSVPTKPENEYLNRESSVSLEKQPAEDRSTDVRASRISDKISSPLATDTSSNSGRLPADTLARDTFRPSPRLQANALVGEQSSAPTDLQSDNLARDTFSTSDDPNEVDSLARDASSTPANIEGDVGQSSDETEEENAETTIAAQTDIVRATTEENQSFQSLDDDYSDLIDYGDDEAGEDDYQTEGQKLADMSEEDEYLGYDEYYEYNYEDGTIKIPFNYSGLEFQGLTETPRAWDARVAFLEQVGLRLYMFVPAITGGVLLGIILWMFTIFTIRTYGVVRKKIFGEKSSPGPSHGVQLRKLDKSRIPVEGRDILPVAFSPQSSFRRTRMLVADIPEPDYGHENLAYTPTELGADTDIAAVVHDSSRDAGNDDDDTSANTGRTVKGVTANEVRRVSPAAADRLSVGSATSSSSGIGNSDKGSLDSSESKPGPPPVVKSNEIASLPLTGAVKTATRSNSSFSLSRDCERGGGGGTRRKSD